MRASASAAVTSAGDVESIPRGIANAMNGAWTQRGVRAVRPAAGLDGRTVNARSTFGIRFLGPYPLWLCDNIESCGLAGLVLGRQFTGACLVHRLAAINLATMQACT